MNTEGEERDELYRYVIGIADNALITGQRLGEWVGHCPQLEEEMATANFALDYIGQARVLYSYAGELRGDGKSADDIAFLRDSIDFHNLLLLEQPNGDFAQTIVRQFLFEAFFQLQLQALTTSSDRHLREFSARATKEIGYHLRHTRLWVVRLGDGTEESRRRMQAAVDTLWPYTGEMFSADDIDLWAEGKGVGPNPAALMSDWDRYIDAALREATLTRPTTEWMAQGGKCGHHTEHHGYLLAEMQFLQRAYPGATW